ncbi:MAG: peptide/nickel transport system ATP-binding protein [Pseudoalteromonas tetraodonis]|jgi:peptide/nickel transport system ATP-binding protein
MNAENSVLKLENLSVSLPLSSGETVYVVDGLSLDIKPGQRLGLVGESGCGKSMSVAAATGLLPSQAETGGAIYLDGEDVSKHRQEEWQRIRGRTVASIGQQPMNALNPYFKIGAQLLDMLKRCRGISKRAAKVELLQAFSDVQLPNPDSILMRYPQQLSGGQLQRVMIALAIACRSKLLIADEPTTALDVTVQAEIVDLLDRLCNEHQIALLFISHDLPLVSELCDYIAVMYAGRIMEFGSAEEIVARPRHPYSRALIDCAPVIGRDSLQPILGSMPTVTQKRDRCHFADRCSYVSERCRQETPQVDSSGVACFFPLALGDQR